MLERQSISRPLLTRVCMDARCACFRGPHLPGELPCSPIRHDVKLLMHPRHRCTPTMPYTFNYFL